MSRLPQDRADRGSQKWLQFLVNAKPELLNTVLVPRVGINDPTTIQWLSPREDDEYAEYVDDSFITRLGIALPHYPLRKFWPQNGPHWDGLGICPALSPLSAKIFVIEAKSHFGEICTPSCGAGRDSLIRIKRSLEECRLFLGAQRTVDWTFYFYQYTNRLAHLYLLRELNKLDAFLLFVYFLNDEEMG